MNLLSVLLFSFALLADVHISQSNPKPLEDLQRSVTEINTIPEIEFVLVAGDITESGDKASMIKVKRELDKLRVPYYITSGNHETTWSESGVMDFNRVFGDNRFAMTHKGVFFIGFNSGPVLKMADGHVAPQDIAWMKNQLEQLPADTKVIAVTHYPLQDVEVGGVVDNWYDVTDLLRQYNTQCIVGGHYHSNRVFECDGITDVLNRSNLRDKDGINGYAIIRMDEDSIRFGEKRIGEPLKLWKAVANQDRHYGPSDQAIRPSYAVNKEFSNVQHAWQRSMGVGIYASPVMDNGCVYIGDDEGMFYCLNAATGENIWTYKTGSRIFSTAAVEAGRVIFGSTDCNIYCLNAQNGELIWKKTTKAAVMGSPVINKGVAFVGGSDGCMYALRMKDGKEIWCFDQMENYYSSRPTIYKNMIYFGAWDNNLYALNIKNGKEVWRWDNERGIDKFAPAAVWPVAAHDRLFIAAPDRYMTCFDTKTGNVIWRTNRYVVRETAGINAEETMVYSKCMWDTVVAFDANTPEPVVRWTCHAGFGYDHASCMPLEKDGTVFVGTKNGLIMGLNSETGAILWKHKIGNSLIQTMLPLSDKECLVTSTDGTVTRVKVD